MQVTPATARSYFRKWGAPPETTEGWELRVIVDDIARQVHLCAQFPGLSYPLAQLTLTYAQAQVLQAHLADLIERNVLHDDQSGLAD
jgi:hypothetical protein